MTWFHFTSKLNVGSQIFLYRFSWVTEYTHTWMKIPNPNQESPLTSIDYFEILRTSSRVVIYVFNIIWMFFSQSDWGFSTSIVKLRVWIHFWFWLIYLSCIVQMSSMFFTWETIQIVLSFLISLGVNFWDLWSCFYCRGGD